MTTKATSKHAQIQQWVRDDLDQHADWKLFYVDREKLAREVADELDNEFEKIMYRRLELARREAGRT